MRQTKALDRRIHGNTVASLSFYRAYSHDVTAAILVFQTNPVGVGLFSYVKNSFVPINSHRCCSRECKRSIIIIIIIIIIKNTYVALFT